MFKYIAALTAAVLVGSGGWALAEEESAAPVPGDAAAQDELKIETSGPEGLIFRLGDALIGGIPGPIHLKLGDYWIGVAVQPLNKEAQQEKKVEGGVVVEQVLPEGPAAKAGLKPQDVIVKAGDRVLVTVGDLVDAVNEAKDKGLKVDVVRDGKSLTIEVTPEKRREEPVTDALPPADAQRLQKWMEKIERDLGNGKSVPFRFHVVRPGQIVPPDVLFVRQLPDDMTVTVTRTGKKPAKVVIEQGGKRYEATEDKLDTLPQEVRPFAESMLGRMPMAGVRVIETPPADAQKAPAERGTIRQEGRLERRLEEMNQRIERLNKTIDELRDAQKAGAEN